MGRERRLSVDQADVVDFEGKSLGKIPEKAHGRNDSEPGSIEV
jgi:hypothetical protein